MGLVDYIASNPVSGGQLALSIALVFVTTVYTIFTYLQTREMRTTREINNKPVIKGDIDHLGSINILLVTKNTGNAAAHNVSTEIYFEDVDVEPTTFKIPVLSPDERYEFGFPLSEEKKFLMNWNEVKSILEEQDSNGILHVQTTWESPFGESYEHHDEIDVLDIMENLSQMLYDDEETKMRKGIEGIKKSLGKIEEAINQEYSEELAKIKVQNKILKEGQRKGAVTFAELEHSLGIDRIKLAMALSSLKDVGLVDYDDDGWLPNNEDVELDFNPE